MKTKRFAVLSWSVAMLIVAGAERAVRASLIAISNNSFEAPAANNGEFLQVLPTGWSGTTPGTFGPWVLDPSASYATGGVAPDGENVFVSWGSQIISQTVATAYAANTAYTMVSEAGIRGGATQGTARYDYRLYAGGQLIWRDIGLNDPAPFTTVGNFLTKTVTVVAARSGLLTGGSLAVAVGTSAGGVGNQIMHDNVRLTATSGGAPVVYNPSFEYLQLADGQNLYGSADYRPIGWSGGSPTSAVLANPGVGGSGTVGGTVPDGHIALNTIGAVTLSQVISETFQLELPYHLYVDVAGRDVINQLPSGNSTIRLVGATSGYVYGSDAIGSSVLTSSLGQFHTIGFKLEPFLSVPGSGILGETLRVELIANGGGQRYWDNVVFYTIPEPSTVFLFLSGGLALCWARRRK